MLFKILRVYSLPDFETVQVRFKFRKGVEVYVIDESMAYTTTEPKMRVRMNVDIPLYSQELSSGDIVHTRCHVGHKRCVIVVTMDKKKIGDHSFSVAGIKDFSESSEETNFLRGLFKLFLKEDEDSQLLYQENLYDREEEKPKLDLKKEIKETHAALHNLFDLIDSESSEEDEAPPKYQEVPDEEEEGDEDELTPLIGQYHNFDPVEGLILHDFETFHLG
ncbi:hypothetical protein [Wenzhou hepe-like virus 1]|uniref:hypothetical protein n=1 Tax=Wenzhou hepe-like virus 1 TaxID=1923566 RepID=UPI00090C5585|nr:hypothetical protein [Wenzhou hepe-like virus 1]APG77841.1 hypothetical protein [Wenzhou hepe-like virus 1]APG77846.1 hypothetical protein [Wenzhou hepe-like virus 1]